MKQLLVLLLLVAAAGVEIRSDEDPQVLRSINTGSKQSGFIIGEGGKITGSIGMNNGSITVDRDGDSDAVISGQNVSISFNTGGLDNEEVYHLTGEYSFVDGITLGDGDKLVIEEGGVRDQILIDANSTARVSGAGSLTEPIYVGTGCSAATLELDLQSVCDQSIIFQNDDSELRLENDLTMGSGELLKPGSDVNGFYIDTNGYVLKLGDSRVNAPEECYWSWAGRRATMKAQITFEQPCRDAVRLELQGDLYNKGLWTFDAPYTVINGNGNTLFSDESCENDGYVIETTDKNNSIKLSNLKIQYDSSLGSKGRFFFSDVTVGEADWVYPDEYCHSENAYTEGDAEYLVLNPLFTIKNGAIDYVGTCWGGLLRNVTWMSESQITIDLHNDLWLEGIWTLGPDTEMSINGNGYAINFDGDDEVGIDFGHDDAELRITNATMTDLTGGNLIDMEGSLLLADTHIVSKNGRKAVTIHGSLAETDNYAEVYSDWEESVRSDMRDDEWYYEVTDALDDSESFNDFTARLANKCYYGSHSGFLPSFSATSDFGVALLDEVRNAAPFSTIITDLNASMSTDDFLNRLAVSNGEDFRSVYYEIKRSSWYTDDLIANLKSHDYVTYRDGLVGSPEAKLAFIKSIITSSGLPATITTLLTQLAASTSSSDFTSRISTIINGDETSALYKLTQIGWYTNTLVAGLAAHNNVNEEDTRYQNYLATLIGSDDAKAAFLAGNSYYITFMNELALSTSWRDFDARLVVINGGSRSSDLYYAITHNESTDSLSWIEATLLPSLQEAGEGFVEYVATIIGSDALKRSFVANIQITNGEWFDAAIDENPYCYYDPYDIAHILYPDDNDYYNFVHDNYFSEERGGDFFCQDVVFDNGVALSLHDRIGLNSTWNFEENSIINGEGNVLDITDGKLAFNDGCKHYLSDVVIYGVGGSTRCGHGAIYVDGHSQEIHCSNVTFVLTDDFTINSGEWYFDSTCTFITGNYQVNITEHPRYNCHGTVRVTVDGCTLWYDTLGYPDSKNIYPAFDTTNESGEDWDSGHVRLTGDGYALQGRIARVIGFESGDYHFYNDEQLSENLFLYQDSCGGYGVQIYFENNLTLDGKGRTIFFGDTRHANTSWLMNVKGCGVTVKNVKLYGLRSEHITGGDLTFGNYTTIELTNNDVLDRDYYVSTCNNSAAVILDLGGKKLDLNEYSIYVSGKLIVRNGTITGIGQCGAQIELDSDATVEYDNVRLELANDVSMDNGRMVISGACTLAGNEAVEFKNNSTQDFCSGTFEMKAHSSFTVENGITYYHRAGCDATLASEQEYVLESFNLAETAKFILMGGTFKTHQWQVLDGEVWVDGYLLLSQGHLVADHTAMMRGNFAITPALNVDIMPSASITIEEGTINYASIS